MLIIQFLEDLLSFYHKSNSWFVTFPPVLFTVLLWSRCLHIKRLTGIFRDSGACLNTTAFFNSRLLHVYPCSGFTSTELLTAAVLILFQHAAAICPDVAMNWRVNEQLVVRQALAPCWIGVREFGPSDWVSFRHESQSCLWPWQHRTTPAAASLTGFAQWLWHVSRLEHTRSNMQWLTKWLCKIILCGITSSALCTYATLSLCLIWLTNPFILPGGVLIDKDMTFFSGFFSGNGREAGTCSWTVRALTQTQFPCH